MHVLSPAADGIQHHLADAGISRGEGRIGFGDAEQVVPDQDLGIAALAREICGYLDLDLGRMSIDTFSNGNLSVQIKENVREKDVFVVQPFTSCLFQLRCETLFHQPSLFSY